MSDFTPGPWSTPHFACNDVECECGYVLVEGFAGAVCTVGSSCGGDLTVHGDDPCKEEAIANAHLISAAPEMYEALKKISLLLQVGSEYSVCRSDRELMGLGDIMPIGEMFMRASVALAKAEGKSL